MGSGVYWERRVRIGAAFCRVALDRGLLVTAGIAATHTAALLLALHPAAQAPSAPVLTVVSPGREAARAGLATVVAPCGDAWRSTVGGRQKSCICGVDSSG